MSADLHAIQNLLARFANSFDLKDWDALRNCLNATIYTDYSDLRGTPPEHMSNQRYAELRCLALQELQTHHLSGNTEIELTGDTARAKVSTVIFRKNADGQTLRTHCLYQFGLSTSGGQWLINSIFQKVFWSDGQTAIHAGIVK